LRDHRRLSWPLLVLSKCTLARGPHIFDPPLTPLLFSALRVFFFAIGACRVCKRRDARERERERERLFQATLFPSSKT
jgi:hypothetical protein